jgi:hypothetical protein
MVFFSIPSGLDFFKDSTQEIFKNGDPENIENKPETTENDSRPNQ